ncbi:MAG: hypothetical protein WBD67_03930 [Terracidiphilus sp.]
MTQHAVGIQAEILYRLLEYAAPFQGQTDFGHKITELMIAGSVLTSNVRGGVPDAWRDYQQVLAELGLIVSTRTSPSLGITELGRLLLAGEIGFAELIGIQALRYQYPNGQKYIIQSRLREELENASIVVPDSLTELQSSRRILIKPGTLILRVLLELLERESRVLSVSECQAFLIPCRENSEFDLAINDIVSYRRSRMDISQVNRHARRNVQDWFRLLGKTDFFGLDSDGNIFLSEYSLANRESVEQYCRSQEDLSSFWIPQRFDHVERLSWFDWFGSLPSSAQLGFRKNLSDDPQYSKENYIEGADDEEENQGPISTTAALNLRPLDVSSLGSRSSPEFSEDVEALLANLRKGIAKRHAKSVLHDLIIKSLAERFIAQGAAVESDPDSIDLLARWPTGNTAIFEVKTVTPRNLQLRLRTAIGQVEEYAYRRGRETGDQSDRIVVVNTSFEFANWRIPFMVEYLGIGLICTTKDVYNAAAPEDSRTSDYWLNL